MEKLPYVLLIHKDKESIHRNVHIHVCILIPNEIFLCELWGIAEHKFHNHILCIWSSFCLYQHEHSSCDNWDDQHSENLSTITLFPCIVSTENNFSWPWTYQYLLLVSEFLCTEEGLEGGKLFKGGNCIR